jgi:tyrosyl-tRNA synthetase
MVQDISLLDDCEMFPNTETVSAILFNQGRVPVSFWGVGAVAPIHLGYDELIVRQKKLVELGCRHIVLLADYHSVMSHNLSFKEIGKRATYYEHYMRHACGLEAEFIRGSEFQTRVDYVEPLLSLVNTSPINVVRRHMPLSLRKSVVSEKSPVSGYLYVLMQCLDPFFLGADLIFAEKGQKKVYSLIENIDLQVPFSRSRFGRVALSFRLQSDPGPLPAVYAATGYDILGMPLLESTAATRITIHETRESLESKVKRMYAPPAGQDDKSGRPNVLLRTFKYSVFPWATEPVRIRCEDGVDREFGIYDTLKEAYDSKLLHPSMCKAALVECVWYRFEAIRSSFEQALLDWVDVRRIGA